MRKYFALVIFAIVTHAAHAQYLQRISQCVTNPPDFAKLSYEEAGKKLDPETRKRICPEYVTNLINQLRYSALTSENRVLVIYLIGELHPNDTNAIEYLLENIDFRVENIEPPDRPPRWGHYPVQEALIKIGGPAVNPILNQLPNETKELRQHLMCEALLLIEGKRGEHFDKDGGKKTVRDQIRDKLARESDAGKQANLEAALGDLDHL